VLKVTANDIDLEPTLSYSIIRGNHDNAFIINRHTGLLSVNNRLDYERVTSYQLTIQVSSFVYLLSVNNRLDYERVTSYQLTIQVSSFVYLITYFIILIKFTVSTRLDHIMCSSNSL